jgi:hypothetical protein
MTTWKGPMDENFLNALMKAYAKNIMDLAGDEEK